MDTERDHDLKDKDYTNDSSTIVVINEQDIKNYWEYSIFENEYVNNEETPRLST